MMKRMSGRMEETDMPTDWEPCRKNQTWAGVDLEMHLAENHMAGWDIPLDSRFVANATQAMCPDTILLGQRIVKIALARTVMCLASLQKDPCLHILERSVPGPEFESEV